MGAKGLGDDTQALRISVVFVARPGVVRPMDDLVNNYLFWSHALAFALGQVVSAVFIVVQVERRLRGR